MMSTCGFNAVIFAGVCTANVLGAGEKPAARPFDELLAADRMSVEEVATLARGLEVKEYLVVAGWQGGITLLDGDTLMKLGREFGSFAKSSERVRTGVLWNAGEESVWVRIGADGEPIEVARGSMVVVGNIMTDLTLPPHSGRRVESAVSVTCGTGYYAYCYGTGGSSLKAKCREDSEDDSDCTAGGHGATSCTIGD